jgi:Tol biopolymer transport system component
MRLIRIICLFLYLPVFAQNGNEPIRVTDLTKIRSIGSIAVSPDGKQVVYVVTAIEPKGEEYNYINQLWLSDLSGKSQPLQLTSKENAGQPAWSPDGKQIAFIRNADNKPQIFLLPLQGGEARQLTTHKYGASNPQFSADGNKILFSSGVGYNKYSMGGFGFGPCLAIASASRKSRNSAPNRFIAPCRRKLGWYEATTGNSYRSLHN